MWSFWGLMLSVSRYDFKYRDYKFKYLNIIFKYMDYKDDTNEWIRLSGQSMYID